MCIHIQMIMHAYGISRRGSNVIKSDTSTANRTNKKLLSMMDNTLRLLGAAWSLPHSITWKGLVNMFR